jgi:hypothetical protein
VPQRKRSQYHTSESKKADQGKPSGETAACASTCVLQKNRTPPLVLLVLGSDGNRTGKSETTVVWAAGEKTEEWIETIGWVMS